MEVETNKPDEKTPIIPIGDPGPSYVFPGRESRVREKRSKELQCFICSGIIASIMIALAIAVCYSLFGQDDANIIITPNDDTPSITIDENMTLPENFFIAFPLIDEPTTTWSLVESSPKEVNDALKFGKMALGDKEMIEEMITAPIVNSPTFRHQKSVSTSIFARKEGSRGYVEDHATRFLAKEKNYQKKSGRSDIGKGPSTNLSKKDHLFCDPNPSYRTYDGLCNNEKHPRWGSSFINFRRALNPDYCDGISAPRCAHDDSTLPSARDVSITIHRPSYFADEQFTVMLAVFGQFLDHDITATALSQTQDGMPIECCNDNQQRHPECYPVPLAKGDPYFDVYNMTCMNFVRSIPAPTNCFGPREQFNQASAFVDGSVVYGSTQEKIKSLRSFKDGKLEMFITPDNRSLLPMSRDPNDGCNEAEENAKGRYCFDSGDARANENLHLTSMHLIFARHHNYLAEGLKQVNPHWNDEKIFQESRKILGAQFQHITYNEFLSVIIGKDSSEKFGILSKPSGINEDPYDPKVNPSVVNVFAAAAFRFAHTLLPGLMKITKELNDTEESMALHKMLFNPFSLYKPHGLDSALISAMNNSIEKSDTYFTTELTEKLFAHDASPVVCGLDLVSLNIQRGRDHGLASYPTWRKHCRLPRVDTWIDFEKAVDPLSFSRIKEIYKNPQDVDIYTGGLAERPIKGGIIGPLLTCIIGDQFIRIKKGDSFWYERPGIFSRAQLDNIFNTTLSTIICQNSDNVNFSQRYIMKRVSQTNRLEKCRNIDSFKFDPWRERRMAKIDVGNDEKNVKSIEKKV